MTETDDRALWWAVLPLLPLLALQGRWLRRSIPRLPEAAGPIRGVVAGGPAELCVAVIGESTAVGVGAGRQDQALAGHLARALAGRLGVSVRWQAAGRSGLAISRFERELLERVAFPVDVAVVVAGVNDVLQLTPRRRWRAAIHSLVGALQARGARSVIFPGVPPLGRLTAIPRPLRDALGARANLLDHSLRHTLAKLPSADYVRTDFPAERACLADDGFHPSSLGYRHWGDALAAHVSPETCAGAIVPGADLS